jgi:hypothetical protein
MRRGIEDEPTIVVGLRFPIPDSRFPALPE